MYILYLFLGSVRRPSTHSSPFQASSWRGDVWPRWELESTHTHVQSLSCIYVGLSVYQCALVLFFSAYYEWHNQEEEVLVCVLRGWGLIFIAYSPDIPEAYRCLQTDLIPAASLMCRGQKQCCVVCPWFHQRNSQCPFSSHFCVCVCERERKREEWHQWLCA